LNSHASYIEGGTFEGEETPWTPKFPTAFAVLLPCNHVHSPGCEKAELVMHNAQLRRRKGSDFLMGRGLEVRSQKSKVRS
jgi:hypothetical protein